MSGVLCLLAAAWSCAPCEGPFPGPCHPVPGHPNVLLQSAAPLAASPQLWASAEPSLASKSEPHSFLLLSVAHSLSSVACSLRRAVLAVWCSVGDYWEMLPERPLLWPGSAVSLSHALAQQPPMGSALPWFVAPCAYNGGCLACARQERVGWGVVRTRSGALATLVAEDLPCGCACRAGLPVGVTPWCCRAPGLWKVTRLGCSSCSGNGSRGEWGSEGLGQAAAGLLAAPGTGCLVWLQLPFGKGWQSQLPEGEWDLL